MADPPPIPRDALVLRPDDPPRIVRLAGRLLLVGQAVGLKPGATVRVRRRGVHGTNPDLMTTLRVGQVVFATTIVHRVRHAGRAVRYVATEFTGATE